MLNIDKGEHFLKGQGSQVYNGYIPNRRRKGSSVQKEQTTEPPERLRDFNLSSVFKKYQTPPLEESTSPRPILPTSNTQTHLAGHVEFFSAI